MILAGDFQAQAPIPVQQTISTRPIPTPKHLLMHHIIISPHVYLSTIPSLHLNIPYITRCDRKSGRALDYIMVSQDSIHQCIHIWIDHTYLAHHIDIDDKLIYMDFTTNLN